MGEFTVDTKDIERFDKVLLRFVDELGIASEKVVRVEAAFLFRWVMRFIAPKSNQQGRGAVRRDIIRAVTPLDPDRFSDPRIAEVIRNKDLPAIAAILLNVDGWKNWAVEPFDPVQQHQRQRDRRGRIQHTRKIFTPDLKEWNRYVKKKQRDVGSAKASFNVAQEILGGNKVPSWVARHNTANYAVTLNLLDRMWNPSIMVETRAKGVVSDPDLRRAIRLAVATRTRSMTLKLNRMLNDPLKHANLFAAYE